MSCTFSYVEKALREVNPKEADRLNEEGINTWRKIKDSKLFTLNKNKEYSLSKEGTKQRVRQDEFLGSINENNFIFYKNNEVKVNLLQLTQLGSEGIMPKKDLYEFVDESKPLFVEETIIASPASNRFEVNKKLLFNNNDINKSYLAKDILQNIIDSNLDFSKAGTDLVFKAINLLGRTNSRSKIVSQERFDELTNNTPGEGEAVMAYDSNFNTIYTTEENLSKFKTEDILEAFLHEVAHNLSIKAIVKPETWAEKDFNQFVKKAFEQYKYLAEKAGSKSYGFTNEKEFVAEIYSNAKFQQELIDLDKSLWRKFKDALRRLFDLPKSLANDELINSILLIEKVEGFIENSEVSSTMTNFNEVMFKKTEEVKNIELDTIDKELQNAVYKSIDRIDQLITRTKSVKNPKNKEQHEKFIKSFESLLEEIKSLEQTNQWKAITSYTKSFSSAINSLNASLNRVLVNNKVLNSGKEYSLSSNEMFKPLNPKEKYVIAEDLYEKYKDSDLVKKLKEDNLLDINDDLYDTLENKSKKDIGTKEMLGIVSNYEEYLSAYDLLEEIDSLIKRSQNDNTLDRKAKIQIAEIKNTLTGLKEGHEKLTAGFINVKKAYAVNLFARPENNTKTVNIWKNKLYKEYNESGITSESKEEYFGRMISTKYKNDYENALIESARKIVYDPYFDISSAAKNTTDLLNINSPLINLMSNVIGRVRDSVRKAYHDKQFEMIGIFEKYSKKYGQNSQSKMFGNIVQLSKSGTYYLKGEYNTDFIDTVENDLYPILNKIKEVVASHEAFFGDKKELAKQLKNDSEYQDLKKKRAAWFKEHTVSINGATQPKKQYRNANLTAEELSLVNYFKSETVENDKNSYNGKMSLIRGVYGAVYYKLPSVSKSDLERTLEGDIKGQLKDKWTDLTETKADDINYGEAVGKDNKEKRLIKIGYRSKVEAKNQSLDLFSVYRKEALNAINYKEKKAKENELKLFVDIAKEKNYKRRSKSTGEWLKNKYSKNSPGETFGGEHSQELAKIEGLLETHLYDILSYSGEKIFGTKVEAAKAFSMVNGFAASIAMTANFGSGAVNIANGCTQMFIEAVGGDSFSRESLRKAEYNYGKNIMNILEDLNQPVKKSFHNQMLDMFDIFGGFDTATQEFIRNSYAKKIISTHSMNGLNEMGEHMMNSVLTEAILRDIKVMNSSRNFINKEGVIVIEKDAASLFDMLSLDDKGKLVMSDKVVYTKKNLDTKYHSGGKTHINYLIKKKGHDIFGVYDPLMKAEIAKTWWGKTLMMFKNFFLSGLEYRYKGFSSSLKSKDELTDDDISFNNAQQEFTEGTYTSFIRFMKNGVIPALKNQSLSYLKDNYNSLSEYEKSNLNKTTLEIGLTMVLLPLLGYVLALAKSGDDDDELFFALYVFRRLESELSQFRDPRELNRMIQNPVAANRFIQNSLTAISDIISPLNFAPKNNEVFFDYLSEDTKHENILIKHIKKVFPFTSQMDKQYKQLYSLVKR